jgi:hypothetical protein
MTHGTKRKRHGGSARCVHCGRTFGHLKYLLIHIARDHDGKAQEQASARQARQAA